MTAVVSPRVPVLLPLVEVTIDETGAASVAVDHTPYDDAGPVSREAVEGVLHEIASSLGPLRARVIESDGSEFNDVVVPEPTDAPATDVAREPAVLAGTGFLPGEDVDVAVIVAHRQADGDGRAHLRLPPAVLSSRAGTLVLLGRTSGAFTVCEP